MARRAEGASRSRLKIAYVIETIATPNAGTEKYLYTLLQLLDRSRFDPALCVLQTSGWLSRSFTFCPVYVVGCNSLVSLRCARSTLRFSRYLEREKFDIVQTHFADGNVVGSIATKLAHVPVLVSSRRNQGYWHTQSHRLLLRILNSWTTCFLTNAKATADWAVITEGIARERCVVIPNGVDVERYRPASGWEKQEARRVLELQPEAPIVVAVANLRPIKALEVFLEALRDVVDVFSDAVGLIVGHGPEEGALRQVARSLGIEGSVRFLGSRDDVPVVLRASDIGVLSSDSESSSNSLVEYMAAGLPVVCTDAGGAREVVSDGKNGYIVPRRAAALMARHLVSMIRDGHAAEMGRRGRERVVERYSLNAVIRAHESLYSRLGGR